VGWGVVWWGEECISAALFSLTRPVDSIKARSQVEKSDAKPPPAFTTAPNKTKPKPLPLPDTNRAQPHQHKGRKVLLPGLDLGAGDEAHQHHDHVADGIVPKVNQQGGHVGALAGDRVADADGVDLGEGGSWGWGLGWGCACGGC